MIPLHEAQETVLAGCAPLTPQQVAYTEMTGRVLDQDVVAVEDVPPFHNTAVDGYAVRAADTERVPVELVVVDTLAAGAEPKIAVNNGEAIRIMTGAPMPQGADAVVMVEDSVREGDAHVSLSRAAKVGDGIAQKQGMEQPIYYWNPSISPGSIAFYTGNIAEWKNNLFVGALGGSHIIRLVLNGNKIVGEERLLEDKSERWRDLVTGKDGALYAVTDSGNLYKIAKK